MTNTEISVVIPTYNRVGSLEKALDLLSGQTCASGSFEVIVVDDGSRDDIEGMIKRRRDSFGYPLTFIRQVNAGPASARNKGVRLARAGLVLFIGDDIMPKEDLVQRHLDAHKRHPGAAILGFVEWSKDAEITDFMRYISPDGPQFRYSNIKDAGDCGFRHFYTANISIGKDWLTADPFDEDFPFAAFEDTELAYRLEKKGLRIVFDEKAIGYHYHPVTFDSFKNRMRTSGISGALFLKKHPEAKKIVMPIGLVPAKIVFFSLRSLGPVLKYFSRELFWYSNIVSSYIEGLEEGIARYKP